MATADLNVVCIVGRLTKDPDLRYANNGTPILNMSIAVNSSRKDGDQWISEANFFDVSYFGKPAEAVRPYLGKGKQIAVQGSLKQDRWEKDGQKFSRVNIKADSVELLGSRADSSGGFTGSSSGSFGGYQQQPSYSQPASGGFSGGGFTPQDSGDVFGGDNSGFPEDIPF